MLDLIEDAEIIARVKEEAEYVIENSATLRETAEKFGVSQATVHRDLTERLLQISNSMYAKVRKVLNYNYSQSSSRGGQAVANIKKKQS